MEFTKIDVAEAHIRTAVRLFLKDAHPIPVHTLACSAREILTQLGDKLGVDTVLHNFAQSAGISLKDAHHKAHSFVGFMKHADRNPTAVLKGFDDTHNDPVLFFACHDFGRVAKGMPVEAQVFEAWFYATNIERVSSLKMRVQRHVRACRRKFPGIRRASRIEQKQIGLRVLEQALRDPALQIEFHRVVILPESEA